MYISRPAFWLGFLAKRLQRALHARDKHLTLPGFMCSCSVPTPSVPSVELHRSLMMNNKKSKMTKQYNSPIKGEKTDVGEVNAIGSCYSEDL